MKMFDPVVRWITLLVAFVTMALMTAEPVKARVLSDVRYGPHAAQRMDVYLPANPRGAPIIMMVHGGAWFFGRKDDNEVVRNKVSRWVPKGFVFVSIDYRLLPKAGPIKQARDVARAMAKVQDLARKWGANPRELLVMGHSSGAHIAALAAASARMRAHFGVKPWRGTILLDTAALDVVKLMQGSPRRFHIRAFGRGKKRWIFSSPLHRLRRKTAPLLIICSTLRRTPCSQARSFAVHARRTGTRVDILKVSLRHRPVNSLLGRASGYTARVEKFMASLSGAFAARLAK